MTAGIQIFNGDRNVLIDQDFENLRIIKQIRFIENKNNIECTTSYNQRHMQQAAGYLFNPGVIYTIKIPKNTCLCAVTPLKDAPFSYEVFNLGNGEEAFVMIHKAWRDGDIGFEMYCFGTYNDKRPKKSHRYGLQVFKEDGTVAFDALNTDYLTVVDFKVAHIPMMDFLNRKVDKTYLKIRGLENVAYAFYATSMCYGGYDRISYIFKPSIKKANGGVDIGMLMYQAQGRFPAEYNASEDEEKNALAIPILCVDVGKYAPPDNNDRNWRGWY